MYALHNAVDMPALLPDGSPSELSVSSMLTRRELGDDGTPPLPPVPEESAARARLAQPGGPARR